MIGCCAVATSVPVRKLKTGRLISILLSCSIAFSIARVPIPRKIELSQEFCKKVLALAGNLRYDLRREKTTTPPNNYDLAERACVHAHAVNSCCGPSAGDSATSIAASTHYRTANRQRSQCVRRVH